MVCFCHAEIINLQAEVFVILEKRIAKNFSEKNVLENEYNISKLKYNVFAFMDKQDLTLRELSDKAELSYDTLKTFLYGDSRDCKLSTVIHLSKAFGITIDELVEADTIDPVTVESLKLSRELPINALYLVRWFIRHQISLYKDIPKKHKVISVMNTVCTASGNVKISNEVESLDISDCSLDVRSKVFIGIKVPCDRYMPTYSPYDTLLIANDRNATPQEHIVVIDDGNLYIVKRKEVIENGKKIPKYFSIRDGKCRISESEVDEIIGYVAAVHTT